MLRRHRLDEARAEYACDAIEHGARAQAQLLEQLLDVSRAIAGKLDLHLAPAHIAGIVEAAIDAVRPDADDKKVRISSRLDRSIPLLIVDPERLQQVVVNMVTNAVKFSAEEGAVQVELRRDDRFVEIVVEDHGVGIKQEFASMRVRSLPAGRHEVRRQSRAGARDVDCARHCRTTRRNDHRRQRRRRQGRHIHCAPAGAQ